MDFLSLSPRPIPPRKTSPVAKSEEKRLFSQANHHIVENCQQFDSCKYTLWIDSVRIQFDTYKMKLPSSWWTTAISNELWKPFVSLVISMNGTFFGKQQWLTVELSYVKKYPESKWKFSKVTAKLIRSWKTVQGHEENSKENVPSLNLPDMQCPYGSLQCHEKSMNLVRTFSCQRLIRQPQN